MKQKKILVMLNKKVNPAKGRCELMGIFYCELGYKFRSNDLGHSVANNLVVFKNEVKF